jgi:hypothetical protein
MTEMPSPKPRRHPSNRSMLAELTHAAVVGISAMVVVNTMWGLSDPWPVGVLTGVVTFGLNRILGR